MGCDGYPIQALRLPDQMHKMDCRAFQKDHVAFIDDTLPVADMLRMQAHLGECEACARHDSTERRALLLFRNLPRVEPSANFRSRLDSRLREARLTMEPTPSRMSIRNYALAAGLVLIAGTWAAQALGRIAPPRLSLAPVVATIPEPASPLADPALVASVSTGMPVWPVALLAEQAPVHFANAEFQLTSFTR